MSVGHIEAPYHSDLSNPMKVFSVMEKGSIMSVDGLPVWHLTVSTSMVNHKAQKGQKLAVGVLFGMWRSTWFWEN